MQNTVKPLLSGHLSISQKLPPTFTVNLTSIQRSPLLSGRGHRLDFPHAMANFIVIYLCYTVTLLHINQ